MQQNNQKHKALAEAMAKDGFILKSVNPEGKITFKKEKLTVHFYQKQKNNNGKKHN